MMSTKWFVDELAVSKLERWWFVHVNPTFFPNGMIQKFFPGFDDTLSTQYY